MARAFGPRIGLALRSWGVAPGWYEAAPLALATAVHLRAKGPFHTSMGQRPMWGIAPRPGHNTSPSANGATHPFTAYRLGVADVGCVGLWHGPSALVWRWHSVPGALPQAGMRPRRWRWPPPCISRPKVAVHLRAKGPFHTAWRIAPCEAPPHVPHAPDTTTPSAIGATHPFTAWRSAVAGVGCAGLWHGPSALVWRWHSVPGALPQAGMRPRRWRCMGRAFGPRIGLAFRSWGVAPGWYEAAPLALATAVHLRAKGPVYLGGSAQTAGAGILLT